MQNKLYTVLEVDGKLYYEEHKIVRKTDKCFVIQAGGRDVYVNPLHRTRYAFASIKEAHDNYIARKLKQVKLVKSQLNALTRQYGVATSIDTKEILPLK